MTHSMKAVRIHEWGDARVLRYEDAPKPLPEPDEVLVRVVAASVNPVDWKIREGWLKDFLPHRLPLVLGWDVSGVVDAVGTDVAHFEPGDAVYSRPDIGRDGTYAEFVVVRESELAPKPATISHVEAASLPLAGITAWEATIVAGGVAAGQRVLIHAAAGGVGSLAVQLAKDRGAQVIATASAGNHALVRALGADEVIDYRSTRLADAVRDVDVVIDTIGGTTQDESWALLKPGGILVSITTPPPEEKAAAARARGAYVFIQPNAAVLTELAKLVDACRLRPVIGAEFALARIADAHALSHSGHARGKIVLYVGQP